jgi:hypothetical protein
MVGYLLSNDSKTDRYKMSQYFYIHARIEAVKKSLQKERVKNRKGKNEFSRCKNKRNSSATPPCDLRYTRS